MNTLQSLDVSVLNWIRDFFMIDAPWFSWVILFLSDLAPVLFALFLIGLWLSGVWKGETGRKHVALDIFWHVMMAFVIYWLINHLLPIRPRPEIMTTLPPLISHFPDNSFPSGHAMFWGASWWALRAFTPWGNMSIFFLLIGGITCFSRIVAGIHYPGDILVGFLVGWGLLELLLRAPHGDMYRKYGHDIPVQLARWLKL